MAASPFDPATFSFPPARRRRSGGAALASKDRMRRVPAGRRLRFRVA